MNVISPSKSTAGIYDVTKSLLVGENEPPLTDAVQIPELVPPEMVPFNKISEFTQLPTGASTVILTCGKTSTEPDNILSPHSLLKVRVNG